MKSAKLVIFFLFGALFSSFAQEEEQIILKDSSYLKKRDYQEQYEYENYQTAFKPKKKNTWAIGLYGGPAWISGDINPLLGWGAGFEIEKALGHLVSLRMQGLYSENRGLDWENNHNHLSYLTTITDLNLQAVININNINFYKKQPSVVFYVFGGLGIATSKTKGDLKNSNDVPYDFSVIAEATSGCIFCPDDEIGRREVRDQLITLMDGKYETVEDRSETDFNISGRFIHPSFIGGGGIRFRLGKRVDLRVEHRFSFHSDDLLDGTNKQSTFSVSQGTDIFQFTNIGFSFKIGKRAESLYWSNPLYTPLDDIRAMKQTLNEGDFFKDSDNDGVLDQFDLESNTPPRAAVTTRGVATDSDNDGIPDYLDKELFTPAGSPIDANGVALDSDNDGVPDIHDMESNTPSDAFVDIHGRAIVVTQISGEDDEFGVVYFELNSSKVKREFFPVIQEIASFLEQNPSAKIEVAGHTDIRGSEELNIRLGERRAESVAKALQTQFGIPESRLNVVTYGENKATVPNLPSNFNPDYDGGHYLNRRVEFKIIR